MGSCRFRIYRRQAGRWQFLEEEHLAVRQEIGDGIGHRPVVRHPSVPLDGVAVGPALDEDEAPGLVEAPVRI